MCKIDSMVECLPYMQNTEVRFLYLAPKLRDISLMVKLKVVALEDSGSNPVYPTKRNKMGSLKKLVTDTRVKFIYYYDSELWYEVVGKDFKFPVPIKDVGTATFLDEDKGILFMRYIRKHIKNLESS